MLFLKLILLKVVYILEVVLLCILQKIFHNNRVCDIILNPMHLVLQGKQAQFQGPPV